MYIHKNIRGQSVNSMGKLIERLRYIFFYKYHIFTELILLPKLSCKSDFGWKIEISISYKFVQFFIFKLIIKKCQNKYFWNVISEKLMWHAKNGSLFIPFFTIGGSERENQKNMNLYFLK